MTQSSVETSPDESPRGGLSGIPPWILLIGFWSLLGLIIATLSHSRMVAVERPSEYLKWLIESLLIWNYWSVISPFVFRLGGRVYANRARRAQGIALLILSGIVVAAAFIWYQVAVSMLVMGESFDRYVSTTLGQSAWFGPYALLIFGGLVSLGYARAYRRRWEENERAVRTLETQLAQAQLDVLKAQLQPHFFFNTLNSICVLIRKGEADRAQAMLTRLGELLRYTLAIGKRQTVPLSDEIEFVKGYLEIEKARFGERLKYQISIEPNAQSVLIPPLVVQPIVENSVRHGIGERTTGGTVSILARNRGGQLVITIADDGVGFEKKGDGLEREGLGIGHTKARLQQLYGDRSLMELSSDSSSGTTVTLKLPITAASGVDE
jgi:sensor histidine kinase YesM